MKECAWITWERQQRNVSMARIVNADYFEFISNNNYFFRVFGSIRKTLSVFRKGYRIIFVQSPSVFLMVSSVIINLFFKAKLVVDAHNSGVFILEGNYKTLNYINFFFLRRADLVLVSNERLVQTLERLSIHAIAVPDPLPDIKSDNLTDNKLRHYDVFIVCSWAEDEPINLYFKVAEQLRDVKFGISGNYRKHGIDMTKVPENLDLVGFIPEQDYFNYLKSSKVVVDLTLREDCLVCGAYEAIAVGSPVIVSDNQVGRELFSEGVIFSKCNNGSLLKSINYALENRDLLSDEVGNTRDYLERLSRNNAVKILDFIEANRWRG